MIRLSRLTALLVSACSLLVVCEFAATASAVTPCSQKVLCGNTATESLRDDLASPNTGYGSSILAVNTAGAIRILAFEHGKQFNSLFGRVPTGYAYLGIDLHENQETSKTACHKATGWVTFADFSHTEKKEWAKELFTNTSPGYAGAWPISINSSNEGCTGENKGKVTIEGVAIGDNFGLGVEPFTGTLTGHFVQAGSCPGGSGGIELAVRQPGMTAPETFEKVEIDNGEAPVDLCFVAANNYLYPTSAPSWTPVAGNVVGD